MSDAPSDASTLRRNALRGAGSLTIRSAIVRTLGLVGNLILIRLLSPHTFGELGFGLSLVAFASFLSDGGFAANLIRREVEPEAAELGGLRTFQVLVSCGVAACVAALTPVVGEVALITALLMVSLPIVSLRMPAVVHLERRLQYGALAQVDVAEACCYLVLAVAGALAHLGIWALVVAILGRTAFATALLLWRVRVRAPFRLDMAVVRRHLGFGVRFQSVGLIVLLRDEGISVLIAVVASFRALGLYDFAFNLMQVPVLLLENLHRIAFPVMSRLRAAGVDESVAVRQITNAVLVPVAVATAISAGAAIGVTDIVFGSKWQDANSMIPFIAIGVVTLAPLSVGLGGLLQARDLSLKLASAIAAGGVAWFALVGLWGREPAVIGVGYLVAGSIEAVILLSVVRNVIDLRELRDSFRLWIGAVLGVATASASAAAVSSNAGLSLLVGAAAGAVVTLGAQAAFGRRGLREAVTILRHAVAATFARRRVAASSG